MSRSVVGRSDRYHHGDLRRALIEAASQLLEERGLDGLVLREVARRAGVSHAAPHHHFPDKAALVTALVEAGYLQLTEAMQSAGGTASPGHNLARLKRIGVAYVLFAVNRPALFRLLCRPELRVAPQPSEANQAATEAGQAAFGVLLDAVRAALASGEIEGQLDALALAAWCIVHGLAVLVLDGPPLELLVPGAGSAVERLAETVTDTLARGLAAHR